ncbi:MAG: FGGY family carbohydrate kinase [Sulfolobales archaeon]|nr:FGGY family carbohydrate kinase [Sulfolobales archaeon]MCX8208455.1 FGGY family carbohydrate kinase [Sulfolobales archaeon]MDW8010105.1 FGGY family carbohydrate kinase [Sulfolobales archaeon]
MYVAVDVGTSSIKTALADARGYVVKEIATPIELTTPEAGAAEHDLERIARLVAESIRRIVSGFEDRVEALSFSNYLHGVSLLGEDCRAITGVLTHLDTRAGSVQASLDELGRVLYERTGCPPLFVYPLAKLLWFRSRELLRRARGVSFVKDYVIYRLAGLRVIDFGTASGTGMLNIRRLRWDDLSLELAGLSEEKLPELSEGARVIDYVSIPELGLRRVAIVPGSFDGALQNIGYGVYGSRAVLNLGSTAVVRVLKREVVLDRDPRMRFFCYYAADGYTAVGAASNNGMTALEWIRQNLLGGASWSEVMSEVEKASPCGGGVYVLPFLAGERFPFRDPYLRLTIAGLGIQHSRSSIARASFEGVSFILKAILDALSENGVPVSELHCGGSGCSLKGFVEVVSSVLGRPVVIYSEKLARLASSLGAVLVAMRALGHVSDLSKNLGEVVGTERAERVEPKEVACLEYEKCFKVFMSYLEILSEQYKRVATATTR